MGIGRPWWGLAGALALFGCDNAEVVTHVHRSPVLDAGFVRLMSAGGGAPVRIFGEPWPGAYAEEVVARLKWPNAMPRELGFRLISAADAGTDPRTLDRLVLVFEPVGSMRSREICAGDRVETNPPTRTGLTAHIVFCQAGSVAVQSKPLGEASMSMRALEAGDWDGLIRALQRTIRIIIADESGRIDP